MINSNIDCFELIKFMYSTYKPKDSFVSLPFLVNRKGEKQIRWFYYDRCWKGNSPVLTVKHIVTLDNTGRCSIVLIPNVQYEPAEGFNMVDELMETFCSQFVSYFNRQEFLAIEDMFAKTVQPQLLELYNILRVQYLT